MGNLGIDFTQCAGYEEQLPHPCVLCKQGGMKSWKARLRDRLLSEAFRSELLKTKEENILKNWLLVLLSPLHWHHPSTNSVGELSNAGNPRDKRNSWALGQRQQSRHTAGPGWVVVVGGRGYNGEGEENFGHSFKTSIRMHLTNNFIYCQNSALPSHGAWLPPYSFFCCYLYLGLVFLNVFFLTVAVDRSSPVTIWLLK